MARLFVRASSHFLQRDEAPVTAAPMTVACWIRPVTLATGGCLICLPDKDIDGDRFLIEMRGPGQGNNLRWGATNGGGFVGAQTSTGPSANVWHHACGVEASATDRRCYLDGGGKGTNVASRTPLGVDRISLGVDGKLTPVNFFDGDIGHVAIWNVALTDQDVATLASGVSPLKVRRDALVYYCPINGQSPELDVIGRKDMTVTGAAKSEEPPIPHSIVAP